jgi:hypothetical protein
MSAGAATPERYRVRGVEAFAAGEHRGKAYTIADLDDMVANFRKLSTGNTPLHRPPVKIGHREQQHKLDEDGHPEPKPDESHEPAAGWVSRLWRRGNVLMADIDDMAPAEAKAISQRRFRKTSAEIYDPDQATAVGIKGHKGMVFRSLAYLGADPPAVKGLADSPMPQRYSEASLWREARKHRGKVRLHITDVRAGNGAWQIFSEVTAMAFPGKDTPPAAPAPAAPAAAPAPAAPDAGAVMAELQKHGFTPEELQGASPALMAAICRVCGGKDEAAGAAAGGDDQMQAMMEKFMEEPDESDDEGNEKYTEKARRFMERFGERLKKFAERCKMGEEPGADDDEIARAKKGESENMSEKQVEALADKVAAAAIAKVAKYNEQTETNAKATATLSRKERVEADVKRLADRIGPTERDAEREILSLYAEDTSVHKFSEAGKTVSRTRYDQRIKVLEARRPIGTERFRDGSPGTGDPAKSASQLRKDRLAEETATEAARVKVLAFEKFSEEMPEEEIEALEEGFKAARKHDKSLTAERFLAG